MAPCKWRGKAEEYDYDDGRWWLMAEWLWWYMIKGLWCCDSGVIWVWGGLLAERQEGASKYFTAQLKPFTPKSVHWELSSEPSLNASHISVCQWGAFVSWIGKKMPFAGWRIILKNLKRSTTTRSWHIWICPVLKIISHRSKKGVRVSL